MELVKESEFVKGGLVMGIIMPAMTAALYSLRSIPGKIKNVCYRYGTVNTVIDQGRLIFYPMLRKLEDLHGDAGFGNFVNMNFHDNPSKLTPSGVRWHRSGLTWVRSSLSSRDLQNAESNDAVTHSINLTFYGLQKRKALAKLLEEADVFRSIDKEYQEIYRWESGRWDFIGESSCREIESVVCDFSDELIGDLDTFTSSEDWYSRTGIPYRRTYLFTGPPGTGKSSMAVAIANHLKRDLRIINLNTMSSGGIVKALANNNSLFLIEDIDATNSLDNRELAYPQNETIG